MNDLLLRDFDVFLQSFGGRGEVDLEVSLAAVRLTDLGEADIVEAGKEGKL